MPDLPGQPQKGTGLFGWLGRQVAYVTRAIRTDVNMKTLYRNDTVEELPHPIDPNIKLRRRVIDEVIAEHPTKKDA